jgi:hypothetical protein
MKRHQDGANFSQNLDFSSLQSMHWPGYCSYVVVLMLKSFLSSCGIDVEEFFELIPTEG